MNVCLSFHSYDDFSSWGVVKIGIQYYRPLIKIIYRTAKHRTTAIPSEKTMLSWIVSFSLFILNTFSHRRPVICFWLGLDSYSQLEWDSTAFHVSPCDIIQSPSPFSKRRDVSDVLQNFSWRQPRVRAGPSLINITLQTLSAPAPAHHRTLGNIRTTGQEISEMCFSDLKLSRKRLLEIYVRANNKGKEQKK